MKTGAVIIADRMSLMNDFRPMLKIDETTIIKRIIFTLKQAGVNSIIVITGIKAAQLEKHISHMGVVCVCNEHFDKTHMFDSVRIGLKHLQYECDRIFLASADIPLFSEESVIKLLNGSAEISCTSYKGKDGNLLLISSELIPSLLTYTGSDGLWGAIEYSGKEIERVPVEDAGMLLTTDASHDYGNLLYPDREIIKRKRLHFTMKLRLAKEEIFFGPGVVEFLLLVDQTGSMQTACHCMQMSYSKGLKMVNMVEEQLGSQVLTRRTGGSGGGSSHLTEQGKEFLQRYIDFQSEANTAVETLFKKYFTQT